MRHFSRKLFIWMLLGGGIAFGAEPNTKPSKPAFTFQEAEYFARWSENDQNEFTPEGQEDLDAWTDMMTIDVYRKVKDEDELAAAANGVLENYKRGGALIVRTDSVPRSEDTPAEHLVVAVFAQPTFMEAAFCRSKLADGMGCSCVYSHRIYGKDIGDEMSEWLKTNGPATEKALMAWDDAPPLTSLPRNSPA